MLTSFPNGELICTRNSTRYKWYLKSNQASTYLPKKQRSLAEQLAAKKYLTLLLEDLQNECRALEYYLRHHHKQKKSAELLLKSPEYQRLLSPYFTPKSKDLANWSNAPYEQNQKYPEQLVHHSISGHFVRSKLQLYTTHGIIPSIHLITTYETHDNPLDMKTVERIIAEYFT